MTVREILKLAGAMEEVMKPVLPLADDVAFLTLKELNAPAGRPAQEEIPPEQPVETKPFILRMLRMQDLLPFHRKQPPL